MFNFTLKKGVQKQAGNLKPQSRLGIINKWLHVIVHVHDFKSISHPGEIIIRNPVKKDFFSLEQQVFFPSWLNL